MSEETKQNTGSSKSSEDLQTLQEQLAQKDLQLNIFQEMQNHKSEEYFRMQLVAAIENLTNKIEESLNLISVKINNVGKAVAAQAGIEVKG